jgi:hypothetical protein
VPATPALYGTAACHSFAWSVAITVVFAEAARPGAEDTARSGSGPDDGQRRVHARYVLRVAGNHGMPTLFGAERHVDIDHVVVAATCAQQAHTARDIRRHDGDDGEPDFQELDGPLFLLGACALVDTLWAAVGEDPLTEVRRVLLPLLADAAPDLNSEVAADALIGAFATEYRCELPGDAELLKRIGHLGGDPLENLVAAGAVPPGGILPVGLAILSALAHLCRSGSASVLQPAA